MLIALGPLVLVSLLVAVTAGWLCSRRQPFVQVIGLALAVLIVSVCVLVAFALLGNDIDARWKIASLLTIVSFSVIGISEAIIAYRGLKAHAGSTRLVRR
jgi:hypothetical protein